jgi:hypothetical protein
MTEPGDQPPFYGRVIFEGSGLRGYESITTNFQILRFEA